MRSYPNSVSIITQQRAPGKRYQPATRARALVTARVEIVDTIECQTIMKGALLNQIRTVFGSTASRETKARRVAELIRGAGGYGWVGIYDADPNREKENA